jgi:hypothetical protein
MGEDPQVKVGEKVIGPFDPALEARVEGQGLGLPGGDATKMEG